MRRMHHSRGFGVQSPYDYRFIRYVVNEHWPYYAYDELAKSVTGIDKQTRKLCRLYFRIANWLQPDMITDYEPGTEAYQRYMEAGCRKAKWNKGPAVYMSTTSVSAVELCRMSLSGDFHTFYTQLVQHVDARSVLVIEGIKRDNDTRDFWNQVMLDHRTGVTFDLYYCGIVFFNKKRYKQNYVVNF